MSSVTELETELATYRTARDKILNNAQEIGSTSGRSQSFAKLDVLEKTIMQLEHRIALAKNGGKISKSTVIFRG